MGGRGFVAGGREKGGGGGRVKKRHSFRSRRMRALVSTGGKKGAGCG